VCESACQERVKKRMRGVSSEPKCTTAAQSCNLPAQRGSALAPENRRCYAAGKGRNRCHGYSTYVSSATHLRLILNDCRILPHLHQVLHLLQHSLQSGSAGVKVTAQEKHARLKLRYRWWRKEERENHKPFAANISSDSQSHLRALSDHRRVLGIEVRRYHCENKR
jgi:hypothetical protein